MTDKQYLKEAKDFDRKTNPLKVVYNHEEYYRTIEDWREGGKG